MQSLEKFIEKKNRLPRIRLPLEYRGKRKNQYPALVSNMSNSKPIEERTLSRSHFLERLRIEKLRTDRSKTPLSMILFDFSQEETRGNGLFVREFLCRLMKTTREIDIKGWVAPDTIGLLLLDTDQKGAHRCAEKILNGNGNGFSSVITATYPDDIFQRLLDQIEGLHDPFAFDLDASKKSHRFSSIIKRGIDVVGSLIGMILSSPIIFITAIAVKATSPGPIIFRQTRMGIKGKRFSFYKFRSMYRNSDDQIHRQYVTDLIKGNHEKINQGNADKPLFKMKTDPRITRVGRIIRKLSIDELPQFVNVLKGEMSLVGPRPSLSYEVEEYEPWHLRRILEVKPGITGLWQVDGRSQTSFDDMVRMDLRYVQNWSLWLDVMILIKTVKAVVRANGAV
jgi:exopolysaccharide biosynthesis polyprenyl glycosylphosphotransferase